MADLRKDLLPKQVRDEFRRNTGTIPYTSGICLGYLQTNIVCLPLEYANDFEKLCHANAAAFPLLFRSQPGQVEAPDLAQDFDVRSDLGSYAVFENDHFCGIQRDLVQYPPWHNMVTFYYGCSFSMEGVAESAGLGFRIVAERKNCPLFTTTIPLAHVRVFKSAPMVVTMRPCQMSTIEKLVQTLAPCEVAHGAPIHIGHPSIIGIRDLTECVMFGDKVELRNDEVPVFWACGVSASQSLLRAGIKGNWITHHDDANNYLMVSDIKVADYMAKHKPSFGDQKPRVVALFDKPQFMSILSDNTLQEISSLDATTDRNTSHPVVVGKGTLAHAALILSHSHTVAIETEDAGNVMSPIYGDVLSLAKTLLSLGKSVVLLIRNDSMLADVQEECQKALDGEMMARLKLLKFGEVSTTSVHHNDFSQMSEACQSLFKVVITQSYKSWETVKQLASSVSGTPLNLSHWGYEVTSKAVRRLQACIIHSRYRYRGVGDWARRAHDAT